MFAPQARRADVNGSHQDIPVTAASAEAVARAVLGPGVRIIGASFSGPGAGLSGDAAVWRTDAGTGPCWLDVDFVPSQSGQSVGVTLFSDDVQALSAAVERGLIGIWVNGRELPTEPPPASDPTIAATQPQVRGAATVEVTLRLRLGLAPGELASLRIGLDDLGGVGAVTMTARAGQPALPVAAEPQTAAKPMRRAIVAGAAGIGLGAALSPGLASAAPKGGKGNNGNGNGNQGNGGQQGAVANPDAYATTRGGTITVDLRANDSAASMSSLQIIGINGVAITAGQTVTLSTGQTIRLNADRTVTITAGGDPGTFVFSYTVAAGQGNGVSSSAQVTLTVIPCFVAGTRILTPSGETPVERLRPGDMVMTLDQGPQPLRWAGSRTIAAAGDLGPVHLRAGTFGNHRTLMVSPQHKVLIRHAAASLLFGEDEVLVAARDLVDGRRVTTRPGGEITYVHLMFDRHQVVFSEGLATESFLPGSQTQALFTPDQVAGISALFPHVDMATGHGYGPSARRILKRHEARVLMSRVWHGGNPATHTQGLWQECA